MSKWSKGLWHLMLLLSGWGGGLVAQNQGIDLATIQGTITDEGGTPLPAATVWLLPDSLACLSGAEGQFAYLQLVPGSYRLKVEMNGFALAERVVQLRSGENQTLRIRLESRLTELNEVLIIDEHAKQEDLLATEHLDQADLIRSLQNTFVQSLARLPGLDAINTGVGIAKPVIRGLSFNRVIVNDQGMKQEGQQWGADHGLEVDAFAVSRVEVVKGPASLQYGSDGLGGVINLMPALIPALNSLSGGLVALGKSNNGHLGGSAHLSLNRNDFWLSARYSQQDFGDYRVPADTFVYQGFVLPLFDGYLKNTAGEETNLQLQAGLKRDWGVTRLTYSHYQLQSGLFSGAIGAPRSYALQPDGSRRNLDLPRQAVDHYKLIFNQTLLFGQNHLTLDLGYQQNLRREFGFPEFHNQPEIDLNNTLALQLRLQTFSGNLHYEHHSGLAWRHTAGLSMQHQRNEQAGWEFLLPDFRTWRSGAFFISHYEPLGSRWRFSGGGRLDFGTNESEYFQRYVWNSNAAIIDSLSVPATDQQFFNWSGSLGGRYVLREEQAWLKIHLGKSFRVPYPSETVSNGVHHGTFRHEQGNPDLTSEHGYQFDLGIDWRQGPWEAHLATYFNYFDNFIYLGPSGRLSRLPEAGQIFRYQQNDAFYSGFELDWQLQFWENWTIYQAGEYVWNLNLNTSLSLPFTPQPSLLTELNYRWPLGGSRGLQALHASLGHQYAWANGPNRVDRNERITPAYHLLEASVGGDFQWRNFRVEVSLQGQNLLDAAYLNHLSRYRLINVPEQGRNLILLVNIPFEAKL